MSASIQAKVEEEFPIDLVVSAYQDENDAMSVPPDVLQHLESIAGVESSVAIQCKALPMKSATEFFYFSFDRICSYTEEVAGFAPRFPASVADDDIVVGRWSWEFDEDDIVTLPMGSDVDLKARYAAIAMNPFVFVSPATYARLEGESFDASVVFLSVPDSDQVLNVMKGVMEAVGEDNPIARVDGSAFQKSTIARLVNILVSVLTALLAVAVLIALVGVGNTLTLSVIERGRENAILRALGFRRGQLRTMLLVEALLLALVGGLVGIIAGAFFGWLGAHGMISQVTGEGITMPLVFSIDWLQTLAMIGVLFLAAALASILPGRRAAKASPVEALAED